MSIKILILLAAILFYLVAVVISVNSWSKQRKIMKLFEGAEKDEMKLFFFEHQILNTIGLSPEKGKIFIYTIRTLLASLLIIALISLRGLAILIFGATIAVVVTEDAYKNVVYESGITNVNLIMNFINYFVPHITSGNSADQSFLSYAEHAQSEELIEFYENRDDPSYSVEPHLRQIVEIYQIAKYNEEKGISDYTYILNEMSKDFSQKQVYYNNFQGKIGEIKPIILSYYFGVPILIAISFKYTRTFWMGFWGFIMSIVILILFIVFRVLIFKLQKDTIRGIF